MGGLLSNAHPKYRVSIMQRPKVTSSAPTTSSTKCCRQRRMRSKPNARPITSSCYWCHCFLDCAFKKSFQQLLLNKLFIQGYRIFAINSNKNTTYTTREKLGAQPIIFELNYLLSRGVVGLQCPHESPFKCFAQYSFSFFPVMKIPSWNVVLSFRHCEKSCNGYIEVKLHEQTFRILTFQLLNQYCL